MKDLETGAMMLFPPYPHPDDDNPRYDQDVHILPCEQYADGEEVRFRFGAHEFRGSVTAGQRYRSRFTEELL
jgi:hypothetical protein